MKSEMTEALELCQKALSMMITPAQIDQTSTLQAFTLATEAEAKARAALSVQPAAAVVGEPVAWIGSGSMMAIADGREGFIWPTKADAHPIPLYAAPSAPDGLDEQALDKAAREGYAARCKTNGPRVLDQYASADIMKMQLEDARVIVSAYLAALRSEKP